MLDACSSLKRSWELGILPVYSPGRNNGEWLSPHPNLCSQWLWPGSFSYQCFDSGMVETSSWGSPMRSLNISSVIQSSLSLSLSLSFPWEKLGVVSLPLIIWCWARDRNSGKWGPHISYQLWCGWFCACLGVCEHLNWYPYFSQRELVSVLLHCVTLGKTVAGFLFCHLSDITHSLWLIYSHTKVWCSGVSTQCSSV